MIFFYTASILILFSSFAKQNSILKNRYTSNYYIFILLISVLLLTPFKIPAFYGNDMIGYTNNLLLVSQLNLKDALQINDWEPLFLLLQWIISRFTTNSTIYIFTMLLLYLYILIKVINKLFLPWQRIFVLFLYLNYSLFYSYIFNGIRQGFAMMFALLLLTYIISNSGKFKIVLTGIGTILMHYTAIPVILAMIVSQKIKLKTLVAMWLIFATLFITNLNSLFKTLPFVSSISFVDTYTSALTIEHYGGAINNYKFLIFGGFFVFVGLYLYKKTDFMENKKRIYLIIIKSYIASNAVFLMFGFIAFSNRIASYSWFLIPILLVFPALYNKKQPNYLLFFVLLAFLVAGTFTIPRFF